MKKTLTKLWMGITLSTSIITFAQTGNVGINTTTPGSTLDVRGSFAAQYTAVTAAAYAMSATDFFVAYNGTANGTFTLPAAISGTGNFKGRMYTVKNNTSFTVTVSPAGSETINGNSSVSIGAGQSAQFINTGLTGAASTWEMVNSYGSSASSGDYIVTVPAASDEVVATVNSDLHFSVTAASNNMTNNAGVYTLKAGKTYILDCQLLIYNITASPNTDAYIVFQWVNAATNVALPGGQGVIHSSNYSTVSYGGQPEARVIYTPSTDTTVKVRFTVGNATFRTHGSIGSIMITQVNAGSSGSGSSTASAGDYIIAKLPTAQIGATVGTDVQLTNTLTSKNITNSGGVFTLKAGKTYMLSCQLHGHTFSTINQYWYYNWVDAVTNVPIPTSTQGLINSIKDYTIPIGGQPEARGIFTPSADMTVKVKVVQGGGSGAAPYTFTIHDATGFATITQLGNN